jgi:YD repeat-containing protein
MAKVLRRPNSQRLNERPAPWRALQRLAALMVFLYAFGTPTSGDAQVINALTPETYKVIDSNGINLMTEHPDFSISDLSIGAGASSMGHTAYLPGPNYFADSNFGGFGKNSPAPMPNGLQVWCAALNLNYQPYTASLGNSSSTFCGYNGIYVAASNPAETLVTNADGTLTLTQGDGTQRTYATLDSYGSYVTKIARPDGRITTFAYKTVTIAGSPPTTMARLQSVTRNDGMQFRYTYASNTTPTVPGLLAWLVPVAVTAVNNAIDYCDPMADTCATTQTWPTATYVWTTLPSGYIVYTITDAAGTTTQFRMDTIGHLFGFKAATSSSAETVTYTWYTSPSEVLYATNANAQVWTYSDGTVPNSGINLRGVTSPTNVAQVVRLVFHLNAGVPVYDYPASRASFDDDANRHFTFDTSAPSNHITSVVNGIGVTVSYTYDGRGNVTAVQQTPAAGSGTPSPPPATAQYDSPCTLPVKCNKPNWVKDELNNQTDYMYDPVHGGVTSITSPPDGNGIRPQTRYVYAQKYTWLKNAAGNYVQSPSPIWVLARESFCATSAFSGSACTIAGDEVVTDYDYGPASGPNNLFLRGKAVTWNGQTRRTCYGMDPFGNRLSETLPNAGLGSCP